MTDSRAGQKEEHFDQLDIYLSDRCNLKCSYCYIPTNSGKPLLLASEQIKLAVNYFMKLPCNLEKHISFLGGEPFLHFPSLKRAVEDIRSGKGANVALDVFTNGTLLTRERVNLLRSLHVDIMISLDGRAATHDANHVFVGGNSLSVFKCVSTRLRNIPPGQLGAYVVFTPDTVGNLVLDIDFLCRKGFGWLGFTPALYQAWSREKLSRLQTAFDGLARLFHARLERGLFLPVLLDLVDFEEMLANLTAKRIWWRNCHSLILGADGRFYACDKVLAFHKCGAERFIAGTPESGIEMHRRRELYEEAAGFIESNIDKSYLYCRCPMGIYFSKRLAGENPLESLRNFLNFSKVYLAGLFRLRSVFQRYSQPGNRPRFFQRSYATRY